VYIYLLQRWFAPTTATIPANGRQSVVLSTGTIILQGANDLGAEGTSPAYAEHKFCCRGWDFLYSAYQ